VLLDVVAVERGLAASLTVLVEISATVDLPAHDGKRGCETAKGDPVKAEGWGGEVFAGP
jgi:hypothetical protein